MGSAGTDVIDPFDREGVDLPQMLDGGTLQWKNCVEARFSTYDAHPIRLYSEIFFAGVMKRLLIYCSLAPMVLTLLPTINASLTDGNWTGHICSNVMPQLPPQPMGGGGPGIVLRPNPAWIYVNNGKICAWAAVWWTYFEAKECKEDVEVARNPDAGDVLSPMNEGATVCAAPGGLGGGGSNGGKGKVTFHQDVGQGLQSCEFGELLELVRWDECSASFEHGNPHLHTVIQCHKLEAVVTNSLWVGISAFAKSCPTVPGG